MKQPFHTTLTMAVLLAIATSLGGCDAPHRRDHDPARVDDHADHDDAGDHGAGASEEHAHDPGAIAVTHFTDLTELFVEYPALVVGEESAFAAHLTRLDNFRPVASGRLTVRLSGGGVPAETFSVAAPSVPGIFRPVARPAQAGRRRLQLALEAPGLSAVHDLGVVTVYTDTQAATAALPREEDAADAISFLKEQQWKVEFATAEVGTRLLRESIAATAVIRARSDGEALVSAPAAGHLVAGGAFPRIGAQLAAGEPLTVIAPRVAGDVDVASLVLAAQRARYGLELASGERQRLAGLVAQEAAPQRRLHEAASAEKVARAELEAATRRLEHYRRTLETGEPGESAAVMVHAPIAGQLAEIRITPGGFVQEGQAMFHIVQTGRLWLEARVAEADLGRLSQPTGAWFEVDGFDRTFQISAESNGKLVAFGVVVDPLSRTAPVVFEFDNTSEKLRVGAFAAAHIWTGAQQQDTAIPVQALIDEAGQDIAYVMLGGESFERRVLRLGIRDGAYVQVKSGLAPGERIVTRGAWLVRLAAASPAEAGHGHAH
ncbi:MAG: efflux RND transporter periplasmic adaptor subunit [Xanthomonadales bacterium]|nr:efflux RND transporter periplasmic adaptor subunit [Xanthomonadales bacterium]